MYMINKFINKLPFRDKFIFLSGKLFIKIGSWILAYKNFGFWQPHYNRLKRKNAEADFDGSVLQYHVHGITAMARPSTSDPLVFEQVILQEEYKSAVDIFLLNDIPLRHFLDLGSNIGLASIYIKKIFSHATVIALEPDKNNYAMMVKNFELNHLTNTESLMAGAGKKDCFLIANKRIRDDKEWSISFQEVDFATDIPSWSISSLLKKYSVDEIDFIKMDIEGGEAAIFGEDADISFLNKVKVMAIEIHDEYHVRDTIYKILKENDFFIFNSNETTIAVKRECLKKIDQ